MQICPERTVVVVLMERRPASQLIYPHRKVGRLAVESRPT